MISNPDTLKEQNLNSPLYNYEYFKSKQANKLLVCSALLFVILVVSLFKNIEYPLFWADESQTVIGTERVLHYGYPKVHDGKNVLHDQPYTDLNLFIHKDDDAYIGGNSWGQYYYGVIGYKLAELTNDIYIKTGFYRATYAIAGLLGLIILGCSISLFFKDKFTKYAFLSLFLFFELLSVSLLLHLRQVRYYPLSLLIVAIIISMYSVFRFYKPYNKILYLGGLSLALWILFNTSVPVYFIVNISLVISEAIISIHACYKTKKTTELLRAFFSIIPVIVAFIAICPEFIYFKTFQLSDALSKYHNFNTDAYWAHLFDVARYFGDLELFWLAFGLKIIILLNLKKLASLNQPLLKLSGFLTLFFIIYAFFISRIFWNIFSRYLVTAQPFLSLIIIIDFFLLMSMYSKGSYKLINTKMKRLIVMVTLLFGYTLIGNLSNITGYVYEITHQYKGPLDYTIPYLEAAYPRSDTLVIATNYEETSYMYYLKSKVIVGYIGNNIAQDSLIQPDIIAFRKPWGTKFPSVFIGYLKKAFYQKVDFPVKDYGVNNNPELNYPHLFVRHLFKSPVPDSEQDEADIYVKSK